MSERMIELQRARLLAAKGSKSGVQPGSTQQNGQPGSGVRTSISGQYVSGFGSISTTPQQAAATAVLSEDMEMKIFFEQLQNDRDDSRAESTSGPTVPSALSRRILQQQGVGYLDSTVGAIASAMADRFLASILQQGVACRDHRLKGAEMAQEAERHRRRHKRQYQEEVADRSRRKDEKSQKREKENLATIQAAESLKTKGPVVKDSTKESEPGSGSKSKKKKKPPPTVNSAMQPPKDSTAKQKDDETDEDDNSYDSIDEEEEYYNAYYDNGDSDDFDSEVDGEEEEDEEMIILRDIERPLAAWDFSVRGKLGVDPAADLVGNDEKDDVTDDYDEEEVGGGFENDLDGNEEENDDDDVRLLSKKEETMSVASSSRSDVRSPVDDSKKGGQKRNASSPVPQASQPTNSNTK